MAFQGRALPAGGRLESGTIHVGLHHRRPETPLRRLRPRNGPVKSPASTPRTPFLRPLRDFDSSLFVLYVPFGHVIGTTLDGGASPIISIGSMPAPLAWGEYMTRRRAQRLLRELARESAVVAITDHARERMWERDVTN